MKTLHGVYIIMYLKSGQTLVHTNEKNGALEIR